MKVGVDLFETVDSSFLSVDKNYALIINQILNNQRLLKMLYYSQPDCLKGKNLTPAQKLSLINQQIKIIPVLIVDEKCPIYIIIIFDNFTPNDLNPEFRDCNLIFHILCHPDHWNMGNFQLRPFKIAGEIDAMFNKKKLTGIGETQFRRASSLSMNNQLVGLTLNYKCIQGVEDIKDPLVSDE